MKATDLHFLSRIPGHCFALEPFLEREALLHSKPSPTFRWSILLPALLHCFHCFLLLAHLLRFVRCFHFYRCSFELQIFGLSCFHLPSHHPLQFHHSNYPPLHLGSLHRRYHGQTHCLKEILLPNVPKLWNSQMVDSSLPFVVDPGSFLCGSKQRYEVERRIAALPSRASCALRGIWTPLLQRIHVDGVLF